LNNLRILFVGGFRLLLNFCFLLIIALNIRRASL
jgi:hypothetical protein